MKLIPKVITICLLITLTTISGTGVIIFTSVKSDRLNTIKAELHSSASFIASRLKQKQDKIRSITRMVSRDHVFKKPFLGLESNDIRQQLNDRANIHAFVNYILLSDLDNNIIATSTKNEIPNQTDWEQLLSQKFDQNTLYSPPKKDKINISPIGNDSFLETLGLNKNSTQLSNTYIQHKGESIGILAVSIDWKTLYRTALNEAIEELHVYKNALYGVLITDNQNTILLSSLSKDIKHNLHYDIGTRYTPNQHLLSATKFYNVTNHDRTEGDVSESDLAITLLFDKKARLQPLEALAFRITIISLVSVCVMSMLLYIFLRKILLSRIALLHKSTQRIGNGELDYQVEDLGNDEIGDLGRDLNMMVQQLGKNTTSIETLAQEIDLRQHALFELEEKEQRLSEARKYVDGITHSAPCLLSYIDKDRNYRFVNRNYERWFSRPQESYIGSPLTQGLGEEAYKIIEPHIAHALSGELTSFETIMPYENGGTRFVHATYSPDIDEFGEVQGFFVCVEDITKAKLHEKQLQEHADVLEKQKYELEIAREKAEASVKAKAEFLASMSHEIRTPMNGVLGMLELLMRNKLNEKQKHYANLARSSAESLLNLINDILDFSKIEAGKIELEILDVNLRLLLEDFLESIALRAQEKNLEVLLDIHDVPNIFIKTDPSRLRQILTNLVGNAIKFTEQGEILVRAALNTDTMTLECSVRDTGIGIPEEKIATLFDSFSQVDASNTRKYGGTGLGLAISNQLCNILGGQNIAVKSKLGTGSNFSFNIPVQTSTQRIQTLPNIDIDGTKILVVDDNATNREILQTQLQLWGSSVYTCASGKEALIHLAENKEPAFDIAILDMQMPNMNGAQLCQEIHNIPDHRDVKLIMMTSIGERGEAQSFADIGFSAYFTKPVTTDYLRKAIAVLIEGGETLTSCTPLLTRHHLMSMSDSTDATDKNKVTNEAKNKVTEVIDSARILLVEDNLVNQQVAYDLLEDLGHTIDISENGVEAITRLKQNQAPYDIILMDCQMPEMDGFTASRCIRKGDAGDRHRATPIIALTANAMKGDREKCLASGMNDYLSKPIDFDKLNEQITRWLNTAKTVQAVNSPNNSSEINLEDKNVDKTRGYQQETVSEVWDRDALLKRVRGKPERIEKLLNSFLNSSNKMYSDLEEAIKQNHYEEIKLHAHAFKGLCGNLGANPTYKTAAHLETSARDESLEDVKHHWELFKTQYEELMSVFRDYLKAL